MKLELKVSHLIKVFLIALLVVVIGVVIYLNSVALKYMRSREMEKEQILLSNVVRMWDSTLTNNKIYIDNYMSTSKAITSLNSSRTKANSIYALLDISVDLNEYAMLNYGMEEIFFYSSKEGDGGYVSSYRNSSTRNYMMKTRVRQVIDLSLAQDTIGTWFVATWDDKQHLVYIVERNGNYMGCWASLDYMLEELTQDTAKEDGMYHLFLADLDGKCLTDGYFQDEAVDLTEQDYYDAESNERYLQVSKVSDMVPIIFVEHVDVGAMEASVVQARNIMIIVSIVLVCSLALWSSILEYVLYRPIRNLMVKMGQISEGDFETRIMDKSRLREIRLLYKSFNDMAQELRNLKIAIYEKEINEQKAKLEYLQVQIHPHFLVNGLNSISAMIDMNKVLPAKEMCGYLANYYRYQYKNVNGLIPLQSELEHVETYINIQKMRHPNKVEYYCDVDENSDVVLIPPILLLTFVGNSFKYGMNLSNYKNIIRLTVKNKEGYTLIRISDEGPGFSDEVLEQIQKDEQIVQKGRVCIGIQNAFNRLKLFYGEHTKYRVYNDHGAVVEIEIRSQY